MPRRNLLLLVSIAILSIVCYHRVQRSRYSQTLGEVFDHIERRYLEPVKEPELFQSAVEGMVGRLDEYSTYIKPEALSEFEESLNQQFPGVGMEVSLDPKTQQLIVVRPLVGSPAAEAGVRAGDRLLKIGGRTTQGLPLKDAVRLMRGEAGTPVVVTVQHEQETKPVDLTIVRAVIQVDSVLGDTRRADGTWNYLLEGHPGIGYLRINSFGEKTAAEMRKALDRLRSEGMRGLVLDMRNDPGGLFPAAVAVADMFIDSGVIVTTRSRGGKILRTYQAQSSGTYPNFPMAVLVNQYTASAAEIVAACLQDHKRAAIVGQRTWGKGTVQEVLVLDDDQGAIKLTTASYWRPSGQNIHRTRDADASAAWGVRPDPGLSVPVDDPQLSAWVRWRLQRDSRRPVSPEDKTFVDKPLEKAVGWVEKEMKQEKPQ